MLLIPMELIPMAIDSLTIYLRYNMGQSDVLFGTCEMHGDEISYQENRDLRKDLEDLFKPIFRRLYPGRIDEGDDETDRRKRAGYDLLCAIRVKYAYYRDSGGGRDVDFREPLGDGPYPIPERKMTDEGMEVWLCREQMQMLMDAAEIFHATYHGEYSRAIRFYTDDPACIELSVAAEHWRKMQIDPAYLKAVDSYYAWTQTLEREDETSRNAYLASV